MDGTVINFIEVQVEFIVHSPSFVKPGWFDINSDGLCLLLQKLNCTSFLVSLLLHDSFEQD